MNQHLTRHIVLSAVAVTLALSGLRAAAAVEGPFDFPSAAHFKGQCEDNGGEFTDTKDGNLWCQYPDGGQEVCSTEGDDCYYIPYTPQPPRGPVVGGHPLTQGPATAAPKPGRDPIIAPSMPTVREGNAASDQRLARRGAHGKDHQHGKHGKGKHRKH